MQPVTCAALAQRHREHRAQAQRGDASRGAEPLVDAGVDGEHRLAGLRGALGDRAADRASPARGRSSRSCAIRRREVAATPPAGRARHPGWRSSRKPRSAAVSSIAVSMTSSRMRSTLALDVEPARQREQAAQVARRARSPAPRRAARLAAGSATRSGSASSAARNAGAVAATIAACAARARSASARASAASPARWASRAATAWPRNARSRRSAAAARAATSAQARAAPRPDRGAAGASARCEPAARDRPAIAIVVARDHSASTSAPSHVAVAGLGERDVRADLRVRIAALAADRERLAIRARGAARRRRAGAAHRRATSSANARRCGAPSGARERGLGGGRASSAWPDREQRVAAVELGRAQLGRRAELREHAARRGEAGQGLARATALGEHGAEVELGDRGRVHLADLAEAARRVAIAIAREPELSALLRDHAAQRQRAADRRGIVAGRRADLERRERAHRPRRARRGRTRRARRPRRAARRAGPPAPAIARARRRSATA